MPNLIYIIQNMAIRNFSFLLLLVSSLLFSGCNFLFFQPTRTIHSNPLSQGYNCEAITFESKDGTPLTGLFFPSTSQAKGTIVHFHGNGQNMTAHYLYIAWAARHGYNVFTFDYRGYGASGGKTGSISSAVKDSVAALEAALELPGVDPDKIILFGQSLGSAMALAAAAETGFDPAAIVLEGSFYSYKGVARAYLSRHWITWPIIPLPTIAITSSYAPKNEINRIKSPLLFIHSLRDNIVSYKQGRKLYDVAKGEKVFWDAPDGHTEAFSLYSNYFSPRLLQYLEDILNKGNAKQTDYEQLTVSN